MSVSVYYSARRAEPLTGAESAAVERVVAAHAESFPYDDEESLYLYGLGGDGDQDDEIVAGSTKLPIDPGRWMPVIAHVLDSVTELRRAVGGAEWHVHADDVDVPWDEKEGYALPGMRDAALIAELGSLCDTPDEQGG
ncbi:hypothetical protein OG978_22335 [Streptomyces sp. NBC_01591]|uniref:hypothetical protein n=1 Tax=Streptomyces sp. NBC_01591 TaxID=2975888 RepID=UPI002DD99C1A|nr:hypothetical protein [Streptomyces sp. NBC_01591]WSD69871.1 hypothetical protein OG978_22335 [Streptomyces sp. NBC_01591]